MILIAMGMVILLVTKFKYLLFAGDEYDGEHTEPFCDDGRVDADI